MKFSTARSPEAGLLGGPAVYSKGAGGGGEGNGGVMEAREGHAVERGSRKLLTIQFHTAQPPERQDIRAGTIPLPRDVSKACASLDDISNRQMLHPLLSHTYTLKMGHRTLSFTFNTRTLRPRINMQLTVCKL